MAGFRGGFIPLLIESCWVITEGVLGRWRRFVAAKVWRVSSCCSLRALPAGLGIPKGKAGAGGVKGSGGSGVAAADKEQLCVC